MGMAWKRISFDQMDWMAGVSAVDPVIAVPAG
jgi:hypothetical protein